MKDFLSETLKICSFQFS